MLLMMSLQVCLFVCFADAATPTQLSALGEEVLRHVACGEEHTVLLTEVRRRGWPKGRGWSCSQR